MAAPTTWEAGKQGGTAAVRIPKTVSSHPLLFPASVSRTTASLLLVPVSVLVRRTGDMMAVSTGRGQSFARTV